MTLVISSTYRIKAIWNRFLCQQNVRGFCEMKIGSQWNLLSNHVYAQRAKHSHCNETTYYLLWMFSYGNAGCGVFKWDTTVENFWPKNHHTQRIWLNFGLLASCQKVPKFYFQSQFSTSKIIQIFLICFIKAYQFRSTFLLLSFSDKINF